MKLRWTTTALSLLALLIVAGALLTGCDAGRPMLSNVSISPDGEALVPGSSGIGNPPGAVEVRYTLGEPQFIDILLGGPEHVKLFSGYQDAGDHILRFTGVITDESTSVTNPVRWIFARRVVPDGDYSITIKSVHASRGEATEQVAFQVRNADTKPPSLDNIVVHPDVISPNSDAVDDVAEVTFRTDQTSTLSVDLTGQDGTRVLVLAPIEKGAGEQNVVLNGQDVAGEILPDGTYTVTVRAEDQAGNRVEVQRPLKIEGGGKPAIEVLKVEIAPQQIIIGQAISVSITVKNVGKVPLRTQGPDSGYTYTTNDSYSSIEGNMWTDKAGLWRVGVDWDGNSGGGGAYRYPFRWGFGRTLMPGETVVTGGKIVILKQERRMWFFAGVLQEGVSIVLDRLGRTAIGIDF